MLRQIVQELDRCSPYTRQIPFTIRGFERIPQDVRGVYGIWFRRHCIYVGKADLQPISTRLEQHWRHSHNDLLHAWIVAKGKLLKVSYMVLSTRNNIDIYERYFIARFQPLTNKVRYKTDSWIICDPNRSRG